MHIYDYIIIGSGLTGQTIATRLSQDTKNVLLIEAENITGGSHRPTQLANQTLENGLRYLPATELSIKAIQEIENLIGLKLINEQTENLPETYDASGFKSFVGFGDKSPEFYDQFSYFLSPSELKLNLPFYQIVNLLKEKYQGETLLKSHVTQITFQENTNAKADAQVSHVVVNGSKSFYAQNFIFAGNVRDLAALVSDDVLNPRAKVKLKKDHYWMTVGLDLYHEDTTLDKNNLFVLNGTTDDGLGPCIGRYQTAVMANVSSVQKNQQTSQWLGFVDLNTSEETENIGEVLKKMKRQIKRAFPEMSENIKAERISMSSPITAGELKLNSNGTLHKTQNLWIASAQVSPYANLMGSFMQSQLTLAALGFGDFKLAQHDFANEVTTEETELHPEM